jgi:hypothetical protein
MCAQDAHTFLYIVTSSCKSASWEFLDLHDILKYAMLITTCISTVC